MFNTTVDSTRPQVIPATAILHSLLVVAGEWSDHPVMEEPRDSPSEASGGRPHHPHSQQSRGRGRGGQHKRGGGGGHRGRSNYRSGSRSRAGQHSNYESGDAPLLAPSVDVATRRKQPPGPRNDIVCKYYTKLQVCPFGTGCSYIHPYSMSNQTHLYAGIDFIISQMCGLEDQVEALRVAMAKLSAEPDSTPRPTPQPRSSANLTSGVQRSRSQPDLTIIEQGSGSTSDGFSRKGSNNMHRRNRLQSHLQFNPPPPAVTTEQPLMCPSYQGHGVTNLTQPQTHESTALPWGAPYQHPGLIVHPGSTQLPPYYQ